jgi:predicted alpha/beta hydrolase family esterase
MRRHWPQKVAEWAGYAQQNPVSRRNALRQLIAAARYEAPVSKPVPPLLILASAQDRLVNPRCSRTLATRWNVTYVEHSTAGHDLPLDDAPWVVRQAMRWLQTLPIRP